MKEIWKDIPEYEGLYQVSTLGRVKSLGRFTKRGKNTIIYQDERFLFLEMSKNGYIRVRLYKNGHYKHFSVHRLVAIVFLENPMNLPQVNHKDEDKTNNCVDNLEWCDGSYNIKYGDGYKNRILSNTGKKRSEESKKNIRKSNKHKKTVLQYTLDGEFVREYESTHDVERELYISQVSISECCRGKIKTSHGFLWRYKE